MKLLLACVALTVTVTLTGCSGALRSEASTARSGSTARQIAERIPGCTHIAKIDTMAIIEGGTEADEKKAEKEMSGVTCEYHRGVLMVYSDLGTKESVPPITGRPERYQLQGENWDVTTQSRDFGNLPLNQSRVLLADVQSTLGGDLYHVPRR